jgi:hypothetical protein
MTLLGLCQWLNDTPWSVALRESPWDYYIFGAIHILGIGLFGGMVVLGDLRLLGIALGRERVSEVLGRFRPWKWTGFAAVLVSGALLALSEPLDCYHSKSFWASLLLLVLFGANALAFHFGIYRSVAAWDEASSTPPAARLAAGISLFLLAALVLAGRGIAFW